MEKHLLQFPIRLQLTGHHDFERQDGSSVDTLKLSLFLSSRQRLVYELMYRLPRNPQRKPTNEIGGSLTR